MPGTRRKSTETPRDETPPEDLLRTSPFAGDLAEELAAAEPRRPRARPPRATLLLGAGVLVVAGFAGGVQADRHWGAGRSPDVADLIGQFAAAGGRRGALAQPGGAPAGDGSATTGTVKLVDGDIVYVQTPSGIVRVRTNAATKVGLTKKAKLKDLRPGASVVVQGTSGQDGTMTATSVTQNR